MEALQSAGYDDIHGSPRTKDTMIPVKNHPSQFSMSVWMTFGVMVISIFLFSIYLNLEKQIKRANELRYQSLSLAHELRQSSDDLTRMVRTYVVTGDLLYKQNYQEILDIRDGKKPRPVRYQDIYWDLVLAVDQRPRPYKGQPIALLQQMQQGGFTDEEFAKLALAKANSDALTHTEFAAMTLVESTDPPTEANRSRAILMLNDTAYHQAKATIMRPIYEFSRMSDQHTLDLVHARENAAVLARSVFIFFGLLLFFMLWRDYRILHFALGSSVDELHARIVRLGSGDFFSTIPVAKGMENSVLGWLSETQIELAQIEAERKAAEKGILSLAFYDPLTNLPNRRLLNDRLKLVLAISKRSEHYAALLFLDLDNFKLLNDKHGHAVGDLLLIEVTRRISRCVREMDTLARFGGDEFVLLISELDMDQAKAITKASHIAEKICITLAEPYILTVEQDSDARTIEYHCTSSIGVVLFINHEISGEDILKRGDMAMYQAKQAGRNQYQFYKKA